MHGLPLVHRASVLGAATTCLGGTDKRRRFWGIDDVDHESRRIQPVRVYRQGIAQVHAKRCGVDNDIKALWVSGASAGPAGGRGTDGVGKLASATFVHIAYCE